MKVYIDFDSIFDIRMAIVNALDPELAVRIANNENYLTRLSDDLSYLDGRFDKEAFNDLYAKRGSLGLTDMATTAVLDELFIERCERDKAIAQGLDLPKETLVVNVYPFELDNESKLALKESLQSTLEYDACEVISMLPDLLTASFFRDGFSRVIMYDFNQWLEMHVEELKTVTLHDVRFNVPLILKGKNQLKGTLTDTVNTAIQELKGFIRYAPQPLSTFSMVL